MATKTPSKKGVRPVDCPRCKRPAGGRCRTPSGKELTHPHEERQQLHTAVVQISRPGRRGPLPGQYTATERVSIERSQLDPGVSDDAVFEARMRDRPIVDHYIVQIILHDDDRVEVTIERGGHRFDIMPEVMDEMDSLRQLLLKEREADRRADEVIQKFGWSPPPPKEPRQKKGLAHDRVVYALTGAASCGIEQGGASHGHGTPDQDEG